MSTLSLRLPRSLHEAVRELARAEQTSINQSTAFCISLLNCHFCPSGALMV